MPAATAELDYLNQVLEELELFQENPDGDPCYAVKEGCTKTATWIIRFTETCVHDGQEFKYCDEHKEKLDRWLSEQLSSVRCKFCSTLTVSWKWERIK